MRARNNLIAVSLAVLGLSAAAAAQGVPDEMPFDIPYGAPISVEDAKIAVEAAQAEAERRGWKLAIAVVSPSGDLTYFLKMNDTQLASSEIAVEKARTAARFRRATAVFYDAMEEGHPYVQTLDPRLVASPGGIPLVVNDEIIGGIGCSGATGAQDAVACQAGLAALNQTVTTEADGSAPQAQGAGWQEYTFEDLGLAKQFPVQPTRMQGTYWEWPLTEREPEVVGEAPATFLTARADNIDYRVTIVPRSDRAVMGASMMGECAYLTEESGVEQKNTFVQIDNSDRSVYGHQVVVDRNDDMGRLYNGCFFENGRLYIFSATVRPEHGNLAAPEASEFITSGRFLDGA